MVLRLQALHVAIFVAVPARHLAQVAGGPLKNSSCLPLSIQEASVMLSMSTGFDGARLSTTMKPTSCKKHDGQFVYVLLRIPSFMSFTFPYVSSRLVRKPRGKLKPLPVSVPLRSICLCLPRIESCLDTETLLHLATLVAEMTFHAALRPGHALGSSVLFSRSVETLSAEPQGTKARPFTPTVGADLQSVACHFGACRLLGLGKRATGVAHPINGTVVVDIGAHSGSTFMPWLRGESGRQLRWLIAVEPDPGHVEEHHAHPHLAFLQTAVGDPGPSGWATLHRAAFAECSSLLPLPPNPKVFGQRVGAEGSPCLEPSRSGDINVPVVSLATILAAVPAEEIAVLKIDIQGGDLAAILSAGEHLRRVRRIIIEVNDLPRGHPNMPYGADQPSKEEVVIALANRGFLLDVCASHSHSEALINEEDCLFFRNDLVEALPDQDFFALAAGQFRWDRPEFGVQGYYRGEIWPGSEKLDYRNILTDELLR